MSVNLKEYDIIYTVIIFLYHRGEIVITLSTTYLGLGFHLFVCVLLPYSEMRMPLLQVSADKQNYRTPPARIGGRGDHRRLIKTFYFTVAARTPPPHTLLAWAMLLLAKHQE